MSNSIDHLYAPMRPLISGVLAKANELLKQRQDNLRVVVHDTHRSWEQQAANYAKGRTTPGKIVTNAKPQESAHCILTQGGLPASMAADLWVLTPDGKLVRDAHPAWAVIPFAAYLVAGDRLAMGAAFSSIRGGDWPHLEWNGWMSLVTNGQIKVG